MSYDIETPSIAMERLARRPRSWYEPLCRELHKTRRGRLALLLIRWIARGL